MSNEAEVSPTDLFIEILYKTQSNNIIHTNSAFLVIRDAPDTVVHLYDDIIDALIERNVLCELPRIQSKTRSGGVRRLADPLTTKQTTVRLYYAAHRGISELDTTHTLLAPALKAELFFAVSASNKGYLAVFADITPHKKESTRGQSMPYSRHTPTSIKSILANAALMLVDVYHEVLLDDTLHLRRHRSFIPSDTNRQTLDLHDMVIQNISHTVQTDSSLQGLNAFRDIGAPPEQHPFTLQPLYFNRKRGCVDYTTNDISMTEIRDLMARGDGLLSIYVARQYASVECRPQDVCSVGSDDIDADITSDAGIMAVLMRPRCISSWGDSLLLTPRAGKGVSSIMVGVSHGSDHSTATLSIAEFTHRLDLVALVRMIHPCYGSIPSEEIVISYMDSSLSIVSVRNPPPISPFEAHKLYCARDATFEFVVHRCRESVVPCNMPVPAVLADFQQRCIADAHPVAVTVVDFFNPALCEMY